MIQEYKMNNNLPFTPKTKMADVIHLDYRLIPIIGRFGIDFGFSNKTVKEVCDDYKINVCFFLEIINSYHNHEYFPHAELQNFKASLIVDYLSNTHAYYLNVKVPEIEGYIAQIKKEVSIENLKNIELLSNFFSEYKAELVNHLNREDTLVFPYISFLEETLKHRNFTANVVHKIKEESIEHYARHHENMELKLSDLKNLIIRHLPPIVCKEICQKLLTELFRLEADLEDHSRIEDKVLVPKVMLLEQQILEASETE
ncbi:hemerythrin domain-containing protein [Carboxylicivirga sp. A043]|uniref:hemerythrin domain-containing protein n=1 Tax=Carboxylicivirga litoralis TaxID=2816963 RepID=UPI0021CB97FE|nr:hemerythrin domain-containing protein [Carboxylicivirga sp. A043]MCU4155518.1 hemerythrin domain-containing protein [Carboxylicivirga sp. A043]